MPPLPSGSVTFLCARTCGIYKNGGARFKTDPATGRRTTEPDNELDELVDAYLANRRSDGITSVPLRTVRRRKVLVPTYYDPRYAKGIAAAAAALGWEETTIGDLISDGVISVRGGHGSPGNDQRAGRIPYIKVSDIRGLRINTNPTNLVSEAVARRFWRGDSSGLKAFDLITPNRASNNIGEFAVLLPGEESVVVTKEVFVFRVRDNDGIWDPFVLFWALCLRAVRDQWRRIALMQTNREDCGSRYQEIRMPLPPDRQAALDASAAFREYFTAVADAKRQFLGAISEHPERFIASVFSTGIARDDAAGDGSESDVE